MFGFTKCTIYCLVGMGRMLIDSGSLVFWCGLVMSGGSALKHFVSKFALVDDWARVFFWVAFATQKNQFNCGLVR
ncbi:hypothetical protein P3T40_000718 [Paraburkholderia sp. EB58]|jgi:hypothetical protein